jgi:hypothetical protein
MGPAPAAIGSHVSEVDTPALLIDLDAFMNGRAGTPKAGVSDRPS